MNLDNLPLWATLLLLLGLVTRVTRLVVEDSITEPIRHRLRHSQGKVMKWVSELAHCPWCSSVWVSAATLGAWHVAETATMVVAIGASLSYIASWVLNHEE